MPVLVLDTELPETGRARPQYQAALLLQRPLANLVGRAIGLAVAVPLLTDAAPVEVLILALQLVIEQLPDIPCSRSLMACAACSYAW